MPKIISKTSYWNGLDLCSPSLRYFRNFIAEDPILIKIFNFAAVPNILHCDFNKFPLEGKMVEFSTISRAEKDYLYEVDFRKGYESNREIVDWLGYIIALFELTKITLQFYDFHKINHNYSEQELIIRTFWAFRNRFAMDEIIVRQGASGEKIFERTIGREFPSILFKIIEIPGDVPKTIVQFHFALKPSKEYIEFLKTHLDKKSVENLVKYGSIVSSICYGGPHFDSDQSFYVPAKEIENFSVEFLYKGQKIDSFKYCIKKRFGRELDRAARGANDYLTRDERTEYAEKELKRCVKNFDGSEGIPPAHYFRASLKHVPQHIYNKFQAPIELEHSGEVKKEGNAQGLFEGIFKNSMSDPLESQTGTHEKVEHKEIVQEIKRLLCKDSLDEKIIDSILDETGTFKGSNKINYSAIAEAHGTYINNVKRHWKEIQNRAKRHPGLKDYF